MKNIYLHHSRQTFLPLSKFNCNGSMRCAQYEVVKVNVKIECEKHIYIIPVKQFYHYLNSILRYVEYVVRIKV